MSFNKMLRDLKHEGPVTSRLTLWLGQHSELVLSDEHADLLRANVVATPRVRSASFSSSSRGSCERAQVFGYLGLPQAGRMNPQLQLIFLDGHWRHHRWQMLLLTAGILTRVETPWSRDDLRLKGSLDGVNDEEKWGFELKGISPFGYKAVQIVPKYEHLLQIHTYMLGTGLDLFSLVYENKATQEWTEHVITKDEKVMSDVMDELQTLNEAIDQQELPGMLTECMEATRHDCPYRETCSGLSWDQAVNLTKRDASS